ncbi:MAG: hypothetical protein AB2693_32895 [Candidatus Thiodiazotropha sp.]
MADTRTRNSAINGRPNQLPIGLLNVCGLRRRSMFPEFTELIHNYDMFMVTETKLDLTDIIAIDGYTFHSKPRQQAYIRKSGGIGIFVKNDLNRFLELLDTESDYIFWIKLDKKYTKLDQHLIFGIIYVPPSQSRFLNDDEFENFQNEITHMCSRFDYVYLAGDINAQTADLADYTSADDFLSRYFDFDNETNQFYDQSKISVGKYRYSN